MFPTDAAWYIKNSLTKMVVTACYPVQIKALTLLFSMFHLANRLIELITKRPTDINFQSLINFII
jgi:hypothetical protein